MALAPTEVHPEQHLRPVLGLCAAGAGVDREDRRLAVVRSREHDLQLELVDLGPELRHALGDLAIEARVARLGGELEHHAEVLGRGRELPDAGHRAGELGALPDELLGAPVVLPEGGRRHLGVERGEATLLGRDVKDAPGAHRRG